MVELDKVELKKETYVDKILEIIEYRITSGELKPNDRISETLLAKEFNVSRGPAREALLRLEEMGLVIKSHTGRVVKSFSIDEFRENYELKIIVEAFCCMQGALKATEKEISAIRDVLEKIKPLIISGEYKKRMILNNKFHESLVLCSQNKTLVETYRTQIKNFGWPKHFPTLKYPRPEAAYEAHLIIFEAFSKRDAERVRRLTEEHQNEVLQIMLANLKKRTENRSK